MCEGPHPFIPVPTVIEARMQYTTPGGVAENVLHFSKGSGVTEADLIALGADLVSWHATSLAATQSGVVSLRQIVLTDMSAADGIQHTFTTGLPHAGTVGGGGMPDNVSVAVKESTGHRGRSFRGRIFHIGMPRTSVTNDSMDAGALAVTLAAYQVLLSALFTDEEFVLVVVSLCSEGAWREEGVSTEVTQISIEPTIDSMRRRLAGRGA